MAFFKDLLVFDLEPLDDGRMFDEVKVAVVVVDVDDALHKRHSTLKVASVVRHARRFGVLERRNKLHVLGIDTLTMHFRICQLSVLFLWQNVNKTSMF